ncbi:zona pellucida-binding protein 2-like [Sceloporus undulatus]|uniref:zona pellucida-binding protein 2-like n=1 Tax=Sceloporus undulatus TaxID=8520 RepID=UPI001C4B3339|nr:zona pellucida-binding protein 2-like [Sceloporus undulatus]
MVLEPGFMSLLVLRWILVLLLCNGAGCGQHSSEMFNNETFSEPEAAHQATPTEHMEPIFVHIGAKEITLPCKPAKSDIVFGLNPTYNWTMENGGTHFLVGGATLTLHTFRAEDSGHYICTVSYMEEGQLHTKTFHHIVAGYHIRGELQVLLVFQSSSCDEELTRSFLKTLHEHLTEEVSDFHSDVLIGETTCFPTVDKPMDEFNLQVELTVSPFKEGWDASCYPKINELALQCYRSAIHSNLQKAKEAMTEFLEENKHFPLEESQASHASFINTFFNFLEDGKCQSGYGQTQELEAHCPDCCTLCPPGTYSEATVDDCVLCPIGTYSLHYGESSCFLCQHNGLTTHPGASRAEDCMSLRVSPSRRFPILIVAFALPPLVCLCFIVLFCYCFRRRWQKQGISTTSDEQIEQEEDAAASAEDMVLLDTQEHDSPMVPSSLEDLDNEAAMFSPPVNEAAMFPPPVNEAVTFPPPVNETATFPPPVNETATFPPPVNETAIFPPPASEAAVSSSTTTGSVILGPQIQESPELSSSSPEHPAGIEEVVIPPPTTVEEKPAEVMLSPPLGPEGPPVMEDIVFPPSSPVSDAESA